MDSGIGDVDGHYVSVTNNGLSTSRKNAGDLSYTLPSHFSFAWYTRSVHPVGLASKLFGQISITMM